MWLTYLIGSTVSIDSEERFASTSCGHHYSFFIVQPPNVGEECKLGQCYSQHSIQKEILLYIQKEMQKYFCRNTSTKRDQWELKSYVVIFHPPKIKRIWVLFGEFSIFKKNSY